MMTDDDRLKFLTTLDRMGKLAARLQDICPEVFLFVHFLAFLFSASSGSSRMVPSFRSELVNWEMMRVVDDFFQLDSMPSAPCIVLFGQGSSLLWTHTLRPLYSRPIALTQEGGVWLMMCVNVCD